MAYLDTRKTLVFQIVQLPATPKTISELHLTISLMAAPQQISMGQNAISRPQGQDSVPSCPSYLFTPSPILREPSSIGHLGAWALGLSVS